MELERAVLAWHTSSQPLNSEWVLSGLSATKLGSSALNQTFS